MSGSRHDINCGVNRRLLGGAALRDVRVFISSPGDVQAERKRVERVVERLNGALGGTARFQAIRWETGFYTADRSFQPQIPEAADCDIVIAILRHRLGTALPDGFPRLPTGERYPSGTAYEVLTALEARKVRDNPDVYVFRYPDPPLVRLDDLQARAEVEEQWRRVKAFFDTWFLTPEGHFKAAFHTFTSTDDLEAQAEALLRAWIETHLAGGPLVAWPVALKGSPFRGLEAFGAKHTPVFFGRSRDTVRAAEALKDAADRGTPFLLVVGPSGSGKSSLARAGLVAHLAAPGAVPGVDVWRVAGMRPGEHADGPFAALASQVMKDAASLDPDEEGRPAALPEVAGSDYRTPADLADLLAHADAAAARPLLGALDRVAGREQRAGGYDRPVEARLLLLVDQLDELFGADMRPETRMRFAALLRVLAGTGRIWIVATLRADFYEACVSVPDLLALKSAGAAFDLQSPGLPEIAEIVRAPAAAADLVYEADASGRTLDEHILADAERADMLPLVQYALNRLFEARVEVGGTLTLTLAAYQAMGGLDGAIDQEAERALKSLGQSERACLPRLLRQFVATAEGSGDGARMTVRSVPWSQAAPDTAHHRLVEALVDARVLLSSGSEHRRSVRLAHQRVLESWHRARDLVTANADFFRIRQEIEDARGRWLASGRRRDRLIPPGVALAEAESVLTRFSDELGEMTVGYIRASRRRARLRQRLTAAAALVFLGVAVTAGYFGWRASAAEQLAQRRAEAEAAARHETEEALRTATAAANTLVFDLAQRFADLSVPSAVIQSILEEARRLQDSLAANFPDDPGLQRSRAAALIELGDTYAIQGSGPDALAAYRQALEIARRLADRDPDDPARRRDVLVGLNRIGGANLRLGDDAGALAAYEEALEIAQALARLSADDTAALRSVSVSLGNIGDLRLRAGDAAGAIEAYEQTLAMDRALVARDPGNTDWQRDLAVTLNRIADIRHRAGDAAGALAAYEETLAISRGLIDRDPHNTEWQRDLSISLNRIADLRVRVGDTAGALAAYQDALAIRRTLAARDPDNAAWRRDVAVSLERVGSVHLRAGNAAEALVAFEEGLDIARALAARDPDNVEWLSGVSVALDRIGTVLVRGGDDAGALAIFEEALAIDRALVEREPDNTQWQRYLSISLDRLGDFHQRQGDAATALAAYEEGLDILRSLTALDPDNTVWRRDTVVGLNKIGDLHLGAGDTARALTAHEEALRISRALVARDPDNIDWLSDVSVGLDRIGGTRLRLGDVDGALAAYDEALAIDRTLVERDPDNILWQSYLAVSLNRVGALRHRNGDAAGALSAYQGALGIARTLVVREPQNVQWRRDLSTALEQVGDMHLVAGTVADALTAYQEALQVRRDLLARDPQNAQWHRDVSVGLIKIGDAYRTGGDIDRALATYGEALETARTLLERVPDNAEWRRDVAIALNRTGDARLHAGDADDAAALFAESLAILQALADDASDQAAYGRDLVISHMGLADAHVARDDHGGALVQYRLAFDLARQLARDGRLAPADARLIETLQARLAELN